MGVPDEKRDWRDAVAVVTGAGSGLGEAVCDALAAAGARLWLVGRDEEKLRRVGEKVGQAGRAAEFMAGDVGDARFCARALTAAHERFGRLDVLVNNAGTIHRAPAGQTPEDAWARTLRTNLDGVFWMSRHAIEQMRAQQGEGGAIVNIASTVGLVGASGLAAYCASKGGVVQLTRALALECAPHAITVNAVCPGAIDTPMLFSAHPDGVTEAEVRARNIAMIPQGRLATAAEVARAVVFLATEPHITGVLLPVDGGYTAQ